MESLTEQDMTQPLGVVEVLNRSGAVVRRISLSNSPLRIGRDLASDLLLDDPYVCPQHALLREVDGELIVEDLGSVNGLARHPGGARSDRLKIASGESWSIGRTTLRYRNSAAVLPPTLIDRNVSSPLRQFERRSVLIGLYLLAPLILLLNSYLENATRLQIGKLLLTPVVALLMILLWAALWAFSNRLLSYRWHFATHLGISCAGLISLQLIETVNSYLCFALNFDQVQGGLDHLTQAVVLTFLLFAHLRFVSLASSRLLLRAAALISIATLGISSLPALSEKNDFKSAPDFQVTLKSPAFIIVNRTNTDHFFEQIEKIPAELVKRKAEGQDSR